MNARHGWRELKNKFTKDSNGRRKSQTRSKSQRLKISARKSLKRSLKVSRPNSADWKGSRSKLVKL